MCLLVKEKYPVCGSGLSETEGEQCSAQSSNDSVWELGRAVRSSELSGAACWCNALHSSDVPHSECYEVLPPNLRFLTFLGTLGASCTDPGIPASRRVHVKPTCIKL